MILGMLRVQRVVSDPDYPLRYGMTLFRAHDVESITRACGSGRH
jgi:hypothetical protein